MFCFDDVSVMWTCLNLHFLIYFVNQLVGNNVLGIHCERNRNHEWEKPFRAAVLQVASYHGLVALFQIFHYKIFPTELKELLENDQIVKVDSANARHRLLDYKIKVARAFDVCALPILSHSNAGTLHAMCKEYLKRELYDAHGFPSRNWQVLKLSKRQIKFAAFNVRACIDLYKFFIPKLQPDAEHLDAVRIQSIIEQFGDQFHYEPIDDKKYSADTKLQKAHKPLQDKSLAKLLEELKSQCNEFNVIGFDCEVDIISIKFDRRKVILNLASYDGHNVFTSLSDASSNLASNELKEILENNRIVKVGLSPQHDAKILELYGIKATSMFDLRYMAESCGAQPADLTTMLRKQIEHETVIATDDLRTNHAQAAVTLFHAFAKKLMASETIEQPSNQLKMDFGNIVEKYCSSHFDKDYSGKKDRLKIGQVHVIVDGDQCAQVMEEIKTHCAEYNVLGLDCEWVASSNVALLQLATHRGLCALIRLCLFETLPNGVKELLEDSNIIKVGREVSSDAQKLHDQRGTRVASLLDVGKMAAKCGFRDGGLGSMTEGFLNAKRYKAKGISCSNWEKLALTERQIDYAAKDAQAGIELFKFFAEKVEMNLSFSVGTDYVNYVINKYFADLVIL